MAIRFQKAFGISAATLLRMQSAYDLAKAEAMAGAIDVERVPEPVQFSDASPLLVKWNKTTL